MHKRRIAEVSRQKSVLQSVLLAERRVHVELAAAVGEPAAAAPGVKLGDTGHQELDNEVPPFLA